MEDQSEVLNSALDALYSVPLQDFIAARKRLAADLRMKGLKEQASLISKSSKPTVVAWVLNQLSRRHRKQAEWLLEANENLERALTSRKGGGEYRQASRARHEIVRQLSDSAARILEESGFAVNPQTTKRVMDVLLSVGGSQSAAAAFLEGRLVKDLQVRSADFESTAEINEVEAKEMEIERTERELARLETEVKRMEERATLLEQQSREARLRADRADEVAQSARKEADQIRSRMDEL